MGDLGMRRSRLNTQRREVLRGLGATAVAAALYSARPTRVFAAGGSVKIEGVCDPRFAKVRDAFAANWELFPEVGASVAVTLDGKPVVDLWGGWADEAKTKPWDRDTLVMVASTTKGLTGLCGNMLIERGLLDPEAPVAKYWPEFAANGKERCLVKHVFDHRAGLPDIPPGVMPHDWNAMVTALAAAKPKWEPGTAHAYHSITFGHLVGELIRRVSGQSPGTFLRKEVCEPLRADAWIGVPAELDSRVADIVGPAGALRGSPEWRRSEIPAANGFTNARALARIYAVLACGGDLNGVHLLNRKTMDDATASYVTGRWFGWTDAMMAQVKVPDTVFKVRFARGFALSNEFAWMGPNPKAFGSAGSGGSIAFADPAARVSFAYAQNAHIGQGQEVQSRSGRLINAVYDAFAAS
jgi:CubicO group peptidase (beta-lactamase class C family)